MQFIQRREVGGDLTVLPLDAAVAVQSGELDARLFKVTTLIENGFDDRSRTDIPLIVGGSGALRGGAAAARSLPSIGGSAVRVSKSSAYWPAAVATLRSKGRQWIRLDGPVSARLDKSVPQIGAPAAWQAGFTGKGVDVAVLDSGIDTSHADLDDAVTAAKDFTESPTGTDDRFGHGTHVASIVTGDHDRYQGVAPDAKLLNGKVLDDQGSGSESGVIAGMEWAAAAGAEIVNMSLGQDMPTDGTDPLSQALNRLTEQTGALFVVAAGNSAGMPGSPAAADAALTVGAVDANEQLADFSSRGPRYGDGAIKPDLTAPGVDIVAAKAEDSFLGDNAPNVGDHHLRLSGTSMAAPHVAGAAALVAQRHPDWLPDDLKSALMGTAKSNQELTVFEQGAGRVDAAAATGTAVRALPASLSNGVVRWPHHDDKPISRVVTYRNSGTAPVTLELTAEVRGPDGKPAPAGMFTVSPASLTVPAGGQATATVTTNTAVEGPDGHYSGAITGGGLRIPIAVEREVESYDLEVTVLGFDGKPTGLYGFRASSIDQKVSVGFGENSSGKSTVRLRKGSHFLDGWINSDDLSRFVTVAEPTLRISADAELVLDARNAVPMGFQADRPLAKNGLAMTYVARDTTWGGDQGVAIGVQTAGFDGQLILPSQTTAAPQELRFDLSLEAAGTPDAAALYHLAHTTLGKIPEQNVHRIRDASLARVVSHHAATKPGSYGTRKGGVTKPLPYSLEEYYTPDVEWNPKFEETEDLAGSVWITTQQFGAAQTYKLGRTVFQRWNRPVFGPGLPTFTELPAAFAGRLGDQMRFSLPLLSDSQAGSFGAGAATGSTTLSRDGKVLATSPVPGLLTAEVGSGADTFQLRAESNRDNPLSSRVVANWTFRSDTVVGDRRAALPLLTVRFAPPDQPTANRPTMVPVTVEHYTRTPSRVQSVAVSHDGGTSWQPAELRTSAGKTFAVLKHPAGAKSVSLKAIGSDSAGNTVDLTIVNAFHLK